MNLSLPSVIRLRLWGHQIINNANYEEFENFWNRIPEMFNKVAAFLISCLCYIWKLVVHRGCLHIIFRNRQVSSYHRVDGIVGKICWYLMGRSHAILNVIIGGGPLQSFPSNPTTIPSQDDAHHPPDLHSWESCDVLKSLKVYDEI